MIEVKREDRRVLCYEIEDEHAHITYHPTNPTNCHCEFLSSLFLFFVEVWEELTNTLTHQLFVFDSRLSTLDAGLLISYLSTTERINNFGTMPDFCG